MCLTNLPQARLKPFVVAEVSAHEATPEFAVVGDGELEEFVDDNGVADLGVKPNHLYSIELFAFPSRAYTC